jgi:hypothetical protein
MCIIEKKMNQRKTIRSILSGRLSYRVLVKHLGIPDLVDIIQEYSAQCEFRILNCTVPGFNKYMRNNIRISSYDESRGLLFYMKPLPDNKVMAVCYNLLGNPVDAFPNGMIEECHGAWWGQVAYGRFIIRNRDDTFTIIDDKGHRTVTARTHLLGFSSKGVWFKYLIDRETAVCSLFPWESVSSLDSPPLHTSGPISSSVMRILDDDCLIFREFVHGNRFAEVFQDKTSSLIPLGNDYPEDCHYTVDLSWFSFIWGPFVATSHGAIVTWKHSHCTLELGKWARLVHFDKLRGILLVVKANCEIHVYY